MHEYRAKMGQNGRILIPVQCRQELDLSPGDEVVIIVDDGVAKLFNVKYAIRSAQKTIKQYVKDKQSLSKELIKMRKEEAKNERKNNS